MPTTTGWLTWALLSATFAALTAIFAKIGLQGVDSDFATLLRTVVIVAVLAAFVASRLADAHRLAFGTLDDARVDFGVALDRVLPT